MAERAPVAVVIRRGPTSWARISSWDTDRDVFTHGAWFHGRIFPQKCALSPQGDLFLYTAYKGGLYRTTYTSCWIAISRPPWLHALALWPVGSTYGGGGRFVDDRRVVLRGAVHAHPDHPADGIEVVPGDAPLQRSTGEIPGAEWTGRDQRNRLVFTRDGCVFARTGFDDRLLGDFRGQERVTEPPPDWATAPLGGRPRRR